MQFNLISLNYNSNVSIYWLPIQNHGVPTLTQKITSETDHSAFLSPDTNSQISNNESSILQCVLKLLDENLALDIVEIDLKGKSSIADYMVVASGRSKRQVQSLSEKLTTVLKSKLNIRTKTEGQENGDWVLIDASDVIIHLFRPEVREFYQIEKLWASPKGETE